jgi:C4-dicarboxylate transporter
MYCISDIAAYFTESSYDDSDSFSEFETCLFDAVDTCLAVIRVSNNNSDVINTSVENYASLNLLPSIIAIISRMEKSKGYSNARMDIVETLLSMEWSHLHFAFLCHLICDMWKFLKLRQLTKFKVS